MKSKELWMIPLLAAAFVAGCADTEEYEITGEVSSAQTVSGPITLQLFEVDPEDEAAERVSIKEVQLAEPGAFTETIEATAGSTIVAVALVDANGDKACSEGELWAEAEVTPKEDGTVDPITLALSAAACPAAQ